MSCGNTTYTCGNSISPTSRDCLTINLIQGDDSNILMEFFDDSSGVDIPLDLTGYDIKMSIKPVYGIGNPSYTKTIGNGLQQNGNQLNISFPSTDSVFIGSVKQYSYDILFADNGLNNHWVYGNIFIKESITK